MDLILYFPIKNNYDYYIYFSIKQGFEEVGCIVRGIYYNLPDEEFIRIVEEEKPDFVFDINRVKNEIFNFPKEVKHLCWLTDFWGRQPKELLGSDILYVWSYNWLERFKSLDINVKYLPPATNKNIYRPLNLKKEYDFSFFGYMEEWGEGELNKSLYCNDKIIKLKDFLPKIEEYFNSYYPKYGNSLFKYLEDINCNINFDNKEISFLIREKAIRYFRRKMILQKFINFKLAIYGNDSWKNIHYLKYSYKGFINNVRDINKLLNKSMFLIHDMLYPHTKVFDAMSAKVPVYTYIPKNFKINEWEILGFSENEDYINFIDKINFNVNKYRLKEIVNNCYEKTINFHLWRNRCEQILNDVKNLK